MSFEELIMIMYIVGFLKSNGYIGERLYFGRGFFF